MDNRLKLLPVALPVVLAGCTGGTADGGADSAGGAESVSLATDTSSFVEAEQTSDDDLPRTQRRAVIRSGQVELTVDEFNESCNAIESTAESYGDYVSDSNEYVNRRSGGTYRSGQLVVRASSEDFSAFMTDMKALGEIKRVETNSEDVTDQLVGTGARLSNLYTQRGHLRDLYESADTTEDVLAVEKRLMDVQTEIEQLEAQKQSLEDRVALSTVRVSLSERPSDPAQQYDTPVLRAFSESVNNAFVALRALVVAVAYTVPYLVVFGGLLVILGSEVVLADHTTFRRLTG